MPRATITPLQGYHDTSAHWATILPVNRWWVALDLVRQTQPRKESSSKTKLLNTRRWASLHLRPPQSIRRKQEINHQSSGSQLLRACSSSRQARSGKGKASLAGVSLHVLSPNKDFTVGVKRMVRIGKSSFLAAKRIAPMTPRAPLPRFLPLSDAEPEAKASKNSRRPDKVGEPAAMPQPWQKVSQMRHPRAYLRKVEASRSMNKKVS